MSDKFLTENEVRLLFYELALHTAFLHRCGWAHRDRKPENMLLNLPPSRPADQHLKDFTFTPQATAECQFRDCDLGLARAIPDTPRPERLKVRAKAPEPCNEGLWDAVRMMSTAVNTSSYKPLEVRQGPCPCPCSCPLYPLPPGLALTCIPVGGRDLPPSLL